MFLTILIFIPLFISIGYLIFGNILGRKQVTLLSIYFLTWINIIIWTLLFYTIITKQLLIENWTWVMLHNIVIEITSINDALSLTMSLLIITITSCIIIYSLDYIVEDMSFIRFISYLFLFCFSMLLMCNSGNYIQFFIGWEFVGLASFLLINFWFSRNEANKGGLKAILYNRIGDIFFLCALAYIYSLFGTFKFSVIFAILPTIENIQIINLIFIKCNSIEIIALFLFVAAAAKSAQLFLHSWLVDAMEGPTPVSALLHSATMVTAGIFLILRSSKFYIYSPQICILIIIIGTLTMLVSSFIALSQNDIKRIVAFSTCSQLGLMIISAGFCCYTATYFHLITHAFFKSALFLSCGILIHSLYDEQDIRKMGGLLKFFPTIYLGTIVCSLSLIGFPMLAGFFSKDFILESLYTKYTNYSNIIFLFSCLGAGLTTIYSIRFIYLIFFKRNYFKIISFKNPNVVIIPKKMLFPYYFLIILSIISGFMIENIFSITTIFWDNTLFLPSNTEINDNELEITMFIKTLPLALSFISGCFCYFFITRFTITLYNIKLQYYILYTLISKKFFFDYLYNKIITKTILKTSHDVFNIVIDKGFLEFLGPTGLYKTIKRTQKILQNLHNSYILTYIILIVYFFLLIILFSIYIF